MLMAEKSSSKTVIAVTGASGQLGRLVVSRLLVDESVSEVRAIDLAASPLTDPKLVYHQIDIRNDEIADCFEGVDVVIHLAFVVTHYLPRHEFDEMRNKSQSHDHFLIEPLILLLRRSGLVNSGGLNPSALRFACSKRSFLISLIRSEERQSGSDDQPN